MENPGQEVLFTKVFEDNKAQISRLCSAYLDNKYETEDLFQEVMINVWKSLPNFRGDAKISTWVYRIAVNTAILFNKRNKKEKQLFSKQEIYESYLKTSGIEDSNTQDQENLKMLKQCINQLAKLDRIIISLLLEGLKYQEIAEITGLSVNHVGVKINRIKPILLKKMKGGYDE